MYYGSWGAFQSQGLACGQSGLESGYPPPSSSAPSGLPMVSFSKTSWNCSRRDVSWRTCSLAWPEAVPR